MSPETCVVNMNQRRCNYFLHQINSTVVIFLEYFFANFETFIIMLINHHNYRIHDRMILFRRALDQYCNDWRCFASAPSQTQLLQQKFILGGLIFRQFLQRLCLDRPVIPIKSNLKTCPLINGKCYQGNL